MFKAVFLVFVFFISIFSMTFTALLTKFSLDQDRPAQADTPPRLVLDADSVQGHVLPFRVIRMKHDFNFEPGYVTATVSIDVDGGEPADWMATGIFAAEHTIEGRIVAVDLMVFVPNPWGDSLPTIHKQLASIRYASNPKHTPWRDKDSWIIMPAEKAATLADLDFYKISDELIQSRIDDPDEIISIAEDKAKRIVIKKYGLPQKWLPDRELGLTGEVYHRGHVNVLIGSDMDGSLESLNACISDDRGCNRDEP